MIVVAQCLRHRIVDGKGAGAIDQLRSSSRIARTCASRLRMNEGQHCLGDLDAKLGRYVGISHDAQQELEWQNFRVSGSCGEGTLVIASRMIWMHARVTMLDVAPQTLNGEIGCVSKLDARPH